MNVCFVKRDLCPGCGAADLNTLYYKGYDDPRMQEYLESVYQNHAEADCLRGQTFQVEACRRCGLAFQRNVFNDVGAQRLYDTWINSGLAEQWNRVAQKNRGLWCAQLLFVEKLLHTPEVRMLDYGAGFGDFARLGHGYGWHVDVLEFSEERACTLRRESLQLVRTLEDKERHYDYIHVSQVLEHLADPFKALKAIHRALHDDGVAFVAVPNCRGLANTLRKADALPMEAFIKALLDCSALQHINSFTKAPLLRLCRRAGFECVFRPFLFIGCSPHGTTLREAAKNVVRPFYYHCTTALYLRKARGPFFREGELKSPPSSRDFTERPRMLGKK